MKGLEAPNSMKLFLACFRGVGQVVFANNPVSGVLILIGIFVSSSFVAFNGCLALLSGSVSAHVLQVDRAQLLNGLFSFNPFLVGLSIGALFRGDWDQPGMTLSMLTSLLSGPLCTHITLGLNYVCKRMIRAPPFTSPFVVTTYVLLAASVSLSVIHIPEGVLEQQFASQQQRSTKYDKWGAVDWLGAGSSGVAQIFLVGNPWSGLLIFAGVFLCSPILSISLVAGSFCGLLLAFALGSDAAQAATGLWGFNTALAVAGIVFNWKLKLQIVILSFVNACIAFLLHASLAALFSPLGLPVLTLPFVLATMLMWTNLYNIPNMQLLAKMELSTPEEAILRASAIQTLPPERDPYENEISGYSVT